MLSLKLLSVEILQEMPSGRALRSYRITVHRHRLRPLQHHLEDSPVRAGLAQGDVAAYGAGELARDREAEPGAALRARCGEGLEQALHRPLGQGRPGPGSSTRNAMRSWPS